MLTLLDQGRLIRGRLRRCSAASPHFRPRIFETLERGRLHLHSPTPTPAPKIGQNENDIGGVAEDVRLATTRFMRAINVLGIPSLAIPCGFRNRGYRRPPNLRRPEPGRYPAQNRRSHGGRRSHPSRALNAMAAGKGDRFLLPAGVRSYTQVQSLFRLGAATTPGEPIIRFMPEVTDASLYPGRADLIFAPASEAELLELLARASRQAIPVTFMGALTGVTGAAVPQSGWAISLSRLNRLQIEKGRAIVGPGSFFAICNPPLRDQINCCAPIPTENTPSLGGNIAANASGARSYRFGATREHVLSLRVALITGEILDIRRGQPVDFDVPAICLPHTTKFSAGYRLAPHMDLVDLFIGSEGTLGVITKAELKLLPAPGRIAWRRRFLSLGRSRARCRGSLAARSHSPHDRISGRGFAPDARRSARRGARRLSRKAKSISTSPALSKMIPGSPFPPPIASASADSATPFQNA